MPNLFPTPGPVPLPLAALTPIAAGPVAPVESGGNGGFAAVIAGLGSDGMMLDAPPPLPPPGTDLPPALPGTAARPVQVVDVEDVMVGTVPIAKPIVGTLPAPVTEMDDAAPAEDALQAPLPGSKPIIAHMPCTIPLAAAPTRTLKPNLPVELPPVAERAEAPQKDSSQDSAGDEAQVPLPPALNLVQPAPPAEPSPPLAAEPPALPEGRDDSDDEAVAPIVILPVPARPVAAVAPQRAGREQGPAPLPNAPRAVSASLPAAPAPDAASQPEMIVRNVAAQQAVSPSIPAPQLASATPNSEARPAPAPAPVAPPAPPRTDFAIPPELARQIAQIVRSAPEQPSDALAPAPALVDAAPIAAAPMPVAAAPQPSISQPAQAAPIDLGRAQWIEAMIERIADIAQADGKREAQIRLRPDALGTVDVKIVERDNRLHVTMNADTAQARQLLSEHAPRLQEQAEARGLRLAQTDIGGGHSQHERRPAPEQSNTPLRPRSAPQPGAAAEPDGDLIA